MSKYVILLLTCLSLNLYSKEAVNEYFTNTKCKKVIDSIIEKSGGEKVLKKADNAIYNTFITMKLISLKVSYHQIIKRKNNLFLI